jgi:hypothetical protein
MIVGLLPDEVQRRDRCDRDERDDQRVLDETLAGVVTQKMQKQSKILQCGAKVTCDTFRVRAVRGRTFGETRSNLVTFGRATFGHPRMMLA